MGLPIWRSPTSSPKQAAAKPASTASTVCDHHVGGSYSRSTIRRRSSPRRSPRDTTRIAYPVGSAQFAANLQTSDSPHVRAGMASLETSLSRLDHELNAIELAAERMTDNVHPATTVNQRMRQRNESDSARARRRERMLSLLSNEPPHTRTLPLPAVIGEAAYHSHMQSQRERLQHAREEIDRLESNGMVLRQQRQQLSQLQSDHTQRRIEYIRSARRQQDEGPSRMQPTILGDELRRRFTSSPQPMRDELTGENLPETISLGAVRGSDPTPRGTRDLSFLSSGMDWPPLHRVVGRTMTPVVVDGPLIDGPLMDDLILDRPISDEAVIDGPLLDAPSVSSPDAIVEAVDGLGDRARSVESESEAADENWDTMLSTIAPDTRLPSASSSFASTAASQSFHDSVESSRAPSTFSAGTGMTIPDDPACDGDDIWSLIGQRLNRGEDVPDELWRNLGAPREIAQSLARTTRERL